MGKAKLLRQAGRSKRPNEARSLTKEEGKVLWKESKFGSTTPEALVNTVWWLLTQHLGLRGRQARTSRHKSGWLPALQRRQWRGVRTVHWRVDQNPTRRLAHKAPRFSVTNVRRWWRKMPSSSFKHWVADLKTWRRLVHFKWLPLHQNKQEARWQRVA